MLSKYKDSLSLSLELQKFLEVCMHVGQTFGGSYLIYQLLLADGRGAGGGHGPLKQNFLPLPLNLCLTCNLQELLLGLLLPHPNQPCSLFSLLAVHA